MSFLSGWIEWFASSAAGSFYAVTFATYSYHFLEQAGWVAPDANAKGLLIKGIAALVALLFIYVNYRGVSETGRAGAFMTVGQTATLAFIGLVGFVAVHRDPSRLANFQPFLPNGWGRLLFTMGMTYVAFEGFEVIAQTGDEAIDPRRNLPKAMLYSILIVVITYVVVAAATVVAVKDTGMPAWKWIGQHGNTAFAVAVSRLMPRGGGFLVLMAVIFSSTSALNATVYSATRVSYAMARDGMLPPFLARISAKRKVPHVALLSTSFIVLAIALLLPVEEVAASASAMFLLLFVLVNLCVIKVRRQMGDELKYGFVMPLFPLLPILAILAQCAMVAGLVKLRPVAWIVSGTWLAAALAIYHTYSRAHAKEQDASIITFEEERAVESKPRSILLPLADPANALALIKPTVILAKARDAQVDLLHMVPIPDQAPLSDAPKYMSEGEEAMVEALLYTSVNFPTNRTVQYCRNVARGVLSAARQRNTDMIILGWRGRSYRREFVLGSTVDPVLERAPCDVVVIKGWPRGKIERVLVPVAGGPHTDLAVKVGATFAQEAGGRVTPFNVITSGGSRQEAENLIEAAIARTELPGDLFAPKFVHSDNVLQAILDEAPEHDLVVIGASQERVWQRLVMGSLPENIARRCQRPIAMVKARTPLKSWVRRWI